MTLAIVNARVWTGNPDQPSAEAVAIGGDRVVAVGTTADIRQRAGAVPLIDAGGQFLIPGFIDTHTRTAPTSGTAPPSAEMRDHALDAAMRSAAEQGITGVHHMGTWEDLDTFARAHAAGRLSTRVYAAVPLDSWARLAATVAAGTYGPKGRGDAWLRIGALHGCADAAGDDGCAASSAEALATWISGADAAGLHVAVGASDERANGMLLDIYERVTNAHGIRDRRFRLEHARHLAAADILRVRNLRVIPSLQPFHADDDGQRPERALLDADVSLAFGSGGPLPAPPHTATPLQGIYAAVTRRPLDARHADGWVPSPPITLEEALAAYTIGGAFASFEETQKGTIQPGKLADLTLIDRDLRAIPPEDIRHARIMQTIVGGRTVYRR